MARTIDALPDFYPASRQELWQWLEQNHDTSPGIWLVMNKKASGLVYISWDEVVEDVLCWGWIDSLPRKVDTIRHKLLLTPRRKGSVWSAVNKARIETLIAEQRMRPPGLAAIERAKADGSWDTLTATDSLETPPDLAAALAAHDSAPAFYAGLSVSVRKQILWQIHSAKRPETRTRRITQVAELCAQSINPVNLKTGGLNGK